MPDPTNSIKAWLAEAAYHDAQAAALRAKARQKADVWGLTDLLKDAKMPETEREEDNA